MRAFLAFILAVLIILFIGFLAFRDVYLENERTQQEIDRLRKVLDAPS